MLDTRAFEVYNLGVDVPAAKFIDKAKETGATIVGPNGSLTLAFESMKETVDAIEAAGMREKLNIMIGSGQIDDRVRRCAGADVYGRDAMAAVTLAEVWTGGN